MKKFKFSLENLLKERIRDVEKTQKEMAPTVSRFHTIEDQSSKIAATLSSGILPGSEISREYLSQMGDVYRHLGTEKKLAQEELQKWQSILAEKIKNRKVLEIIKEKRYREWQKSYKKKNEKINEELISNYY